MKKIVVFFICFICTIMNVSALDINSNNAILYNLNDKSIIFEKNQNENTKIASLTKIMTTIVALEKINNLDQKITMTKDMFKNLDLENAYQIGLKAGDKVTYKDLIYGTFIASGADATRGLTMTLTNSENEYVDLMNKKAKEIGLKNTYFTNPIGLDSDGQKSSVEDVAQMFIYALKNKTFQEIIKTKSYSLSNTDITVYSSLHSTGKKFGIDTTNIIGGKTGYTLDAGRCLASIAYDKINNINYLLVTTNAKNTPQHIIDAYNIYNYYFENYKYHVILKKDIEIINLKVMYSNIKNLKIKSDKDILKYLENTFNINDIKLKYSGIKQIDYKYKKGDKLGKLDILYNNEKLDSIDVILNQNIKFSIISYIFDNKIRKYCFIFITLLIISLIFYKIKKKIN